VLHASVTNIYKIVIQVKFLLFPFKHANVSNLFYISRQCYRSYTMQQLAHCYKVQIFVGVNGSLS
jgi:hypothetical protein